VGESKYDAKDVALLHWMKKAGLLEVSASLTLWKIALGASFLRGWVGRSRSVFLNRRAAARYRDLASITPSRERPEETTILVCYKISLVQ